MNKRTLYPGIKNSRSIILTALLIFFSAVSCLKETEKREFKNLIPEKDFVAILTDLHLTNGLLSLPEMRTRYVGKDTAGLYVEIIEGYGYRTGQLDTTIQYYYIRKPKKLIKIYDQMLGKFTEMDLRLNQKFPDMPENVADQWEGKSSYLLPDGSLENPDFEITLTSPGTYTLQFSLTIYPDDQTCKPFFSAWLDNANSRETAKKDYLPCLRYIKDGAPHTYSITGTHTAKTIVVLKGRLYDFSSNPKSGEPNAILENVTFYYSGTVR